MKRFLTAVVLLACAATLYAAGGQEASGPVAGEVTMWGGAYLMRSSQQIFDGSEFAEQNPDIKLVTTGFPYAQYAQKMKTAIASGDSDPDILLVHDRWILDFVGKGLLIDLTDRVDTRQFSSDVLRNVTHEGKIYGVPFEVSTNVHYHRPDALEAIGASYPKKIDDYIAIGEKLKSDGKYFGIHSWSTPNSTFYVNLLYQMGGRLFDDSGAMILDTDEGMGIEAAEMVYRITRFYRDLDYSSPEGFTAIKNGEVVANLQLYSWIHRMKDAIKEGDEPFGKFRIGLPPDFPRGGTNKVTPGPACLLVNKLSENSEAAWRVAGWFGHTEEGVKALASEFLIMGAYKPGLEALQDADLQWPIFGGQEVQAFLGQVTMSRDLVVWDPSPNKAEAINVLNDYLGQMLTDKMEPREAIVAAADKLRASMK